MNGQPKLILGLIWTLILRYHIKIGKVEDNSAKNALLEWVRSKIPEYNIQNFTKGLSSLFETEKERRGLMFVCPRR